MQNEFPDQYVPGGSPSPDTTTGQEQVYEWRGSEGGNLFSGNRGNFQELRSNFLRLVPWPWTRFSI